MDIAPDYPDVTYKEYVAMSRKCKAWSEFGRDNPKHQNPLSKEAFAAGWDDGHLAGYKSGILKALDIITTTTPYHPDWERLYRDRIVAAHPTLFSNLEETPIGDDAWIEDGFGTRWYKTCPQCGQDTMEVVRPGKAQCNNPNCKGDVK